MLFHLQKQSSELASHNHTDDSGFGTDASSYEDSAFTDDSMGYGCSYVSPPEYTPTTGPSSARGHASSIRDDPFTDDSTFADSAVTDLTPKSLWSDPFYIDHQDQNEVRQSFSFCALLQNILIICWFLVWVIVYVFIYMPPVKGWGLKYLHHYYLKRVVKFDKLIGL